MPLNVKEAREVSGDLLDVCAVIQLAVIALMITPEETPTVFEILLSKRAKYKFDKAYAKLIKEVSD